MIIMRHDVPNVTPTLPPSLGAEADRSSLEELCFENILPKKGRLEFERNAHHEDDPADCGHAADVSHNIRYTSARLTNRFITRPCGTDHIRWPTVVASSRHVPTSLSLLAPSYAAVSSVELIVRTRTTHSTPYTV